MCQISMYYHESWPKILRCVNDEGFSILEKAALGEKYFIKKVVSVNTIFFNVFFILSDMKPKDCFAYIIHFLFCKTYAVYYISYVVRL